jgi:hypothetical protein
MFSHRAALSRRGATEASRKWLNQHRAKSPAVPIGRGVNRAASRHFRIGIADCTETKASGRPPDQPSSIAAQF